MTERKTTNRNSSKEDSLEYRNSYRNQKMNNRNTNRSTNSGRNTNSSRNGNYRRNSKKKGSSLVRKLISIILIVLVVYGLYKVYDNFIRVPYKYDEYITKYSKEYKVDRDLVASIIYNESRFNPDAKSNQDAHGLMQIQPETAIWVSSKMGIKDYSNKDLYNPEKNIKMGTWYISYLLNKFQDERIAIAAYNAGPTIVSKWLKDPRYSNESGELIAIPYNDTAKYVDNVLKMKKEYEKIIPNLLREK